VGVFGPTATRNNNKFTENSKTNFDKWHKVRLRFIGTVRLTAPPLFKGRTQQLLTERFSNRIGASSAAVKVVKGHEVTKLAQNHISYISVSM